MHGIHHVTAIAGDPRGNLRFYRDELGLRFVKKTVNFDDPGTYHFYFGDEAGSPGSILTFFPWARAAAGRGGVGQTLTTAFRVPLASIGYWTHRLVELGIPHEAPIRRFGETVLPFADRDGTKLALVGVDGAEAEAGWSEGSVPEEAAIRGFHGVTLLVETAGPTAAVLTDVLGFEEVGREASFTRFAADKGRGAIVDIQAAGGFLPGRTGRGTVHHVAFRAADDAEQEAMVRRLAENHGLHATEQKDRNYFRSVYFREPGGILFEIATDSPGFAVDEAPTDLGTALKLPAFLEARRRTIEAALPDLAATS